jgi:hypothetical protein
MIRWVCIAALLAGLDAYASSATCQERCITDFQRCAGGCKGPGNCTKRCQDQFDTCNRSCAKDDKVDLKKDMPKKCPGPKGKMVPCSDYANDPNKLDTPPPVPRSR